MLLEQVRVSSSMYFHDTKKNLRFSFLKENQSNKSPLLIDLGKYTLCHQNTLILEERSSLYFIVKQLHDCTESFSIATSITHFHP